MTSTICVIPARMASGRFPGKPLKPLLGLALVLHVYERCKMSKRLERILIATCDEEIKQAAEAFGAEVVMTADTHPGCVDRTEEAIATAVPGIGDDDLVLMVQGDEVLVTADSLEEMIDTFEKTKAPIINLASRLARQEDLEDPNTVKVVAGPDGRALYFSRSPIPSNFRLKDTPRYQQTGVVGFSADCLRRFGSLEQTPLELVEHIDMMRAVENGLPVQVVFTERETIGVDTPADLMRAEEMLKADSITGRYLP